MHFVFSALVQLLDALRASVDRILYQSGAEDGPVRQIKQQLTNYARGVELYENAALQAQAREVGHAALPCIRCQF